MNGNTCLPRGTTGKGSCHKEHFVYVACVLPCCSPQHRAAVQLSLAQKFDEEAGIKQVLWMLRFSCGCRRRCSSSQEPVSGAVWGCWSERVVPRAEGEGCHLTVWGSTSVREEFLLVAGCQWRKDECSSALLETWSLHAAVVCLEAQAYHTK